jgi:NodT family efflux transporter outer membrane factor (OMF) lipoprotein
MPESYKKVIPRTSVYGWYKFNDPQLNQLITASLADSPDMKMAEARLRIATHITAGSTSTLWPSIAFNGDVARERFAEFGLVPPPFNGHTYNIGTLGFNLNYELDLWGKNRQMLAANVSDECRALADLAQAQLILSAAVANTYFQLLGAIAQGKIAQENLQQSEDIATIIVKQRTHGIASDIPVKTALANTHSATLIVEQHKQIEMLSRHRLAVLLGKNPLATKMMTRQFAYHPYSFTLSKQLSANLLAKRPDISAAKARVEAAAHRINVAKAYFFPNINLSALYSYQSIGLGHLFNVGSQNNAIDGAIDLPIFDAGKRRANLGVKYAEYDLAVNEYNQTILTALREVADQLSILQTIHAQLLAQSQLVNAIKYNYKLFNSRYKHGIVGYEQVLQLRGQLLEQRSQQVNLQTHYVQAAVAMLKALGGNDGDEQV